MCGASLLAAACGDLVAPEAYAPPTSTSIVDGDEPQIDSQIELAEGVTSRVEEFVPPPPAGYVPTLLVSGSSFILAAEQLAPSEDGAATQLISTPLAGDLADLSTVRAVDDLGGGLVIEESTGAIVYRPAQGEPETLLDGGGALLDVGYWDGSPRAFVEAAPGQVDWIQLLSEPGAELERQTHIQLAEDEQIVAFAASRDIQAVIIQDDQCGQLRFYGSDGQELDLPGPEAPPCVFPGRPTFGTVALSPGGDAVAYTEVTYRGDGTEAGTSLIGQELAVGGVEFANRKIGEDLDTVTSLSFDGQRAAYLKLSGGVETVTVLDLTVERSEAPVDLQGIGGVTAVSFARNPITTVG